MKFFMLATALILAALSIPAGAQPLQLSAFDKVLADYQQVPVMLDHKRVVISKRLEVRTRPIAQAAILDVLRPGAMVGLVSEGGGWSTIDLGAGFLGWIRSDGLGFPAKDTRPPAVATKTLKQSDAPSPLPRPQHLDGASPRILPNPAKTYF